MIPTHQNLSLSTFEELVTLDRLEEAEGQFSSFLQKEENSGKRSLVAENLRMAWVYLEAHHPEMARHRIRRAYTLMGSRP